MKKRSRSKILTALFIAFAVKASAAPTGVTVNGVALDDAASSYGTGWAYVSGTLTLSGAGAFTLSGTNTAGKVRVVVPADVTNAVTLSDLTLQTTGGGQCAFALEQNADVSFFLAGANTLASGQNRAGLEVPTGASVSITNAPSDAAGTLTVTGGAFGAGVGGGKEGAGGTVTINGGTITATGGMYGAGIGGGYYCVDGGAVIINGGTVTATGGMYGAGIGGGRYGNGNVVTITSGTVSAQGKNGSADIGPGSSGMYSVSNTFTGGSICLANDSISPAPSNGTARVWCVTVTNLTPNAAIVVTALEPYGVHDLVADENGKLYLWLPDGDYTFTAGSTGYTAAVDGAATTAVANGLVAPLFATDGTALVFDGTTLAIKIVNAKSGMWYVLYGVNTLGGTWELLRSICATTDGDLVFTDIDATTSRRFFKVKASITQPLP